MSETSPRLALPFLMPSQAQKHVTHNEALRSLDTITQLSVLAFDATVPPGGPSDGDVYALGTGATADWSGYDGYLATWFDSGWIFTAPQAGWRAVIAGETDLLVYDGTDWVSASIDLENLPGVGVNTTSDATNKLAVSAEAALFTHDGSDHRLKINKASAPDTASILFQSGWSGRAEFGLAGSDAFSIKLSDDGAIWSEALVVSAGEGILTTGTMVGSVAAFPGPGDGIVEASSNANGRYTKFADGTLICQRDSLTTLSGAAVTWTLPESFAATDYSISATIIGGTPAVVTLSSRAASSVDLESFDLGGSDTVTPDVCLLAIGRWI